ncbi:ABC transporter gloK [Colletotrichum sidae]|uniref:ABC transporter gloK n=1 Tax=Colletotrichum sidae TaxID=1347389 RepID=A0A4R8T6C7_9PEZI|nr:ABC transporter gloK [Colletotrichum sidae]
MIGMAVTAAERIHEKRIEEIQRSRAYRKVDTAQQALGNTTLVVTPAVTFLLYYFSIHQNGGESLDSAKAFTSLSLISLLSYPIVYFVFAVPRFMGSISSYDRIEEYIIANERDTSQYTINETDDVYTLSQPYDTDSDDEMELESLLLKRPANMTSNAESVQLAGVQTVSEPCGTTDSELIRFENADFTTSSASTEVLRGITLTITRGQLLLITGLTGSGKSSLLLSILGELRQKRGSISRSSFCSFALCPQESWLPGGTVRDTIIGPAILDDAWLSTVIAACELSQDICQLPEQEETIIESNGSRLSGGQKQRVSLARALYSRKDVLLLDDTFSGLDPSTERMVAQNVLGPDGVCRRHGITVVMTASDSRYALYFDATLSMNSGSLVEGALQETCCKASPSMSGARRVREESQQPIMLRNSSPAAQAFDNAGFASYRYYFRAMGWGATSLVFGSSAAFVFCFKFPDVWLKLWTDSEIHSHDARTGMYMTVYILMATVALICLVAFSWSLKIIAVPRAAALLHHDLLSTVIAAPYHILVSAGSGSLITRLAEDLSVIDLQLTLALAKSIDGLFTIIAEVALVAYASALTALCFPILFGTLYVLQSVYLRTSRQVRLLEIEARAPLYSHFVETEAGVVTIRAFAWQQYWRRRQQSLLEQSQRALYITYCTQRWLSLVLDLIVAAVAVIVLALVTQLPTTMTDGGSLGVALANIVTFSSTLAYFIQGWAQLETSMAAVVRIRGFTERTPSENKPMENEHLPPWSALSRASVRFVDVTSAYR